ncbi:hypothetical protein AAMO2058_001634400 [Amorphochlora amoebiformis]
MHRFLVIWCCAGLCPSMEGLRYFGRCCNHPQWVCWLKLRGGGGFKKKSKPPTITTKTRMFLNRQLRSLKENMHFDVETVSLFPDEDPSGKEDAEGAQNGSSEVGEDRHLLLKMHIQSGTANPPSKKMSNVLVVTQRDECIGLRSFASRRKRKAKPVDAFDPRFSQSDLVYHRVVADMCRWSVEHNKTAVRPKRNGTRDTSDSSDSDGSGMVASSKAGVSSKKEDPDSVISSAKESKVVLVDENVGSVYATLFSNDNLRGALAIHEVLVKDSWRSRFGLIAFHMIEKLLRRYPGTPCVCTLNSTQIDHWKVIKRVGLDMGLPVSIGHVSGVSEGWVRVPLDTPESNSFPRPKDLFLPSTCTFQATVRVDPAGIRRPKRARLSAA